MELDCLAYWQELERISEKNREAGKSGGEKDDFLYCVGNEDRMRPILNLMLYWGKKEWRRPLFLREMTEDLLELPAELRQLAGDYQVHIVAMQEIPEAMQEMDSDLRYVFGMNENPLFYFAKFDSSGIIHFRKALSNRSRSTGLEI